MSLESPYPGAIDTRLAVLEEWRRSVDAWRQTMEREGIAVALAKMDGRLAGLERAMAEAHADAARRLGHVEERLARLERESTGRSGARLSWQRAVTYGLGAALAIAAIATSLITLIGGPP